MTYRKKLIEVALPLDAINVASAREKSIRHGHPSTLHLWWARRPLAAARAVIFAQMVDDPSAHPDIFKTEKAQEKERQRLFRIIEDLVLWENTTNEEVLERARAEIWQSWRYTCAENADHPRAKELFDRHRLPAFHDPFAGGGSLPLEAQRLGLEAYASDLNPVAVLINKAMIEIPPKFAGKPPVNPESRNDKNLFAREWHGAQGLAEDVRYCGKWMRDEAEKRIGHLYPKIEITPEMVVGCVPGCAGLRPARPDLKPYLGRKLTVIAWLWARTVKSPNPAFANVDVPLVSTFMLSTKPGKEAYVEPVIENGGYRFTVKMGKPKDAERAKNGTKLARGANFQCVMSGTPIASDHIYGEANAGRMGARLMAIVAEGDRRRIYLAPTPEHEAAAGKAMPEWKPEVEMPANPRWFSPPLYGLKTYGDLFTPRQLVALTTFSDLVGEAMARIRRDALGARASGPHPPKGWHSRGYHPHLDAPDLIQHLSFRLHDSVPVELIARWRAELHLSRGSPASDPRQVKLRELIDTYEDAGHGACWLKDPRIAELVENALLHFDGERYRLIEWCVMPNHVHALIETIEGHGLPDIARSWKTFTAREANKLLGREGEFWMEDYFDRYIRDERHLEAARDYIRNNPVKAKLCMRAEDWQWSSASARRGERAGGPRTQDTLSDGKPLDKGGTGGTAYADAVAVYLGLVASKQTIFLVTQARWRAGEGKSAPAFGRQALPMVWDFADLNPFAGAGGDFLGIVEGAEKTLRNSPPPVIGNAYQADAATQTFSTDRIVSTDPPYYDNIGYADLSDYFYVWLRRSLRIVFPDLFATLVVPKAEELVATPYRHGSKEKAEAFFLDGMKSAMHRLAENAHPAFPVTIYYAFKQTETPGSAGVSPAITDDLAGGTPALPGVSTGWETFLDAVIRAGFAVSGTWPMRTENQTRLVGMVTNALASSIVLVCRRHAHGNSARVRHRTQGRVACGARPPAARQHSASGSCSSGHRPGYGDIHPLYQGARRRGPATFRARGVDADQSNSGRCVGRAGRGLRRRHSLGGGLVRAIWFCRGGIWRGRNALQGEEYQRRRHG